MERCCNFEKDLCRNWGYTQAYEDYNFSSFQGDSLDDFYASIPQITSLSEGACTGTYDTPIIGCTNESFIAGIKGPFYSSSRRYNCESCTPPYTLQENTICNELDTFNFPFYFDNSYSNHYVGLRRKDCREDAITLSALLDGPGVTQKVRSEYENNEELRQSIIDNFRSTCQDWGNFCEGSNTNPVTIPFNNMCKTPIKRGCDSRSIWNMILRQIIWTTLCNTW